MFLDKHCLGCGNGNQSCKIAKCSIERGNVEYCFECDNYPCEKYIGIDKFDSFISHRNQLLDLEKARAMGISNYNEEQTSKMKILNILLANYNDGRKKTFYCVAVNVLEFSVLENLMRQIEISNDFKELDDLSKCKFVYTLFDNKSKELGIDFKLRRKK